MTHLTLRVLYVGATQEERIMQYLEENDLPVVGLREATVLRVGKGAVTLRGGNTARVFRRGNPPIEVSPGSNLTTQTGFAAKRTQ
jgi:dipeptidase E